MIEIVIDTNAFVSILDNGDKWNERTQKILNALSSKDVTILISDIVINESINVLCIRYENKGISKDFPDLISKIENEYQSQDITWISKSVDEYHAEIMEELKNSQGLLNYNDCLLLIYMKKQKLKYIISFDADFDSYKDITRIHTIELTKSI